MNVLSLFDGMSCGQLAFNKIGIDFAERERENKVGILRVK